MNTYDAIELAFRNGYKSGAERMAETTKDIIKNELVLEQWQKALFNCVIDNAKERINELLEQYNQNSE